MPSTDAINKVVLTGTIVESEPLRYTPAGIALARFRIGHESGQVEAGEKRQVTLEMACVAVEAEARLVAAAPLGTRVTVEGFVAVRSKSGRGLELHAATVHFGARDAASAGGTMHAGSGASADAGPDATPVATPDATSDVTHPSTNTQDTQ